MVNSVISQLNKDFGEYINVQDYPSSSVYDFDTNTLFPRKSKKLKGGLYLNTATPTGYTSYALINTKSPTTPFIFPTALTQAIINLNKVSTDPPTKITVVNAPLPVTNFQLSINNAISGFLASFIFSLALSFKFSAVAAFIVK